MDYEDKEAIDYAGIKVFDNPERTDAEPRLGLVVMSFGSTYAAARKKSIDTAFRDIAAAFPLVKTVLAFTSSAVRNRIKKAGGGEFPSVEDAIEQLKNDGCTRIALQPLGILPDNEYEGEYDAFSLLKNQFKRMALGLPLFYWTGQNGTHDDLREVLQSIQETLPVPAEDEAVIICGHGSNHWSNDYFYILQDTVALLGYENYYVIALKGNPTLDDVITKLWRKKINKVVLVPLMMTAGYHVTCDMNGDQPESLRRRLENSNINVRVMAQGIAELPGIRKLFIERTAQTISKLTE